MMILAILFGALAAVLGWLLWRKNRALWQTAKELSELRHGSGSGNRLRLHQPDSTLETLLSQINSLLEDKESEQRSLRARELELRRQIANISHDLRTPLTSILGYLQLLEQENLPPEDRKEALEIIRGRALALQSMITSFYDLSRLEAGEYPLQREQVQLYPLLAELLADFYSDFEAAGLTVELALEEHLPPVWGDRSAILRLFTNLIQNVLKHGTGLLTVRLAAEGQGQVAAFTNDAPDLTQEDVTHVFDRFFTADKMRSGRNTGLGLAIVRELSRRMGIELSARLEQERFTVELRWNLD